MSTDGEQLARVQREAARKLFGGVHEDDQRPQPLAPARAPLLEPTPRMREARERARHEWADAREALPVAEADLAAAQAAVRAARGQLASIVASRYLRGAGPDPLDVARAQEALAAAERNLRGIEGAVELLRGRVARVPRG